MFVCAYVWVVLDEPLELLRVVRTAVVGGPGVADGELVELQHIHHADLRHHTAEQVRTLVRARRCECLKRNTHTSPSFSLEDTKHS